MSKCEEAKVHTDPVFLTLKDRKGAVICLGCKKQIGGAPMPPEDLEATVIMVEVIRENSAKKKSKG